NEYVDRLARIDLQRTRGIIVAGAQPGNVNEPLSGGQASRISRLAGIRERAGGAATQGGDQYQQGKNQGHRHQSSSKTIIPFCRLLQKACTGIYFPGHMAKAVF
ncbi:MAG: hypothetical protein Q8N06_03120, partial [Hydrogenophaga sp.]|nr:hypothetical protein [Hydrogenophaga sp.]